MNQNPLQERWWDDSITATHDLVWDTAERLREHHAGRFNKFKTYRCLYSDRDEAGVAFDDYMFRGDKTRNNVVKSAVDTAVSLLGNDPPLVSVCTIGRWDLQRRARRLSRFLEGLFEQEKIHEVGIGVLKHACIYGTGWCKISPANDGPRVCVERVRPDRVLVDPLEELYEAIRTIYVVTPVQRDRLQALYPEHAAHIEHHLAASEYVKQGVESVHGDFVDVIEAWHQRSSEDSDDGKHVIVAEGVTLLEEDWEHDYLPLERFTWCSDPESIWGIGLVEALLGTQADINFLGERIREGFDLFANQYWAEAGSISQDRVTNRVGSINLYEKGHGPPVALAPTPVHPSFLDREEQTIRRALEGEGISQASAFSQKLPGLNSGKAQLVHRDIESSRFGPQKRDFESFFVEIARRSLDALNEIASDPEDRKKLSVTVGKRTLESLDYSEVSWSESDPYQIRVFPRSALSSRLEGRFQQVEQMIDLGLIDTAKAKRLLDIPDLEGLSDREQAGMDLVDRLIERASDSKPVTVPVIALPWDYAEWAISLAIAEAEAWEAPDEVLDALSEMLSQVEHAKSEIEKKAQAAMPPPMPPQGGPPPGMPPELPPGMPGPDGPPPGPM